MSAKQNLQRIFVIFGVSFLILACSLFTGAAPEPTATAVPTEVPAEYPPTQTIVPEKAESAPTPTEEIVANLPTATLEPKMADTPFLITQVTGYYDDFGDYRVIGLVKNNSERSYDNIEIEIKVFNFGGDLLHTEITNPTMYILPAGQTSPFDLWVYEDLTGAYHIEAEIVGNSVGQAEQTPVEIRNVLLTVDDDSDIHITGEIYNGTLDPVQIDDLAGATFDAEGNLLTADSSTVLGRYLDPGEVTPFRITMTSPVEGIANIASHELFVNAKTISPEGFYDFLIAETHETYVDSYGFFHLVGEITNNSEILLDIELVAGLYDEAGIVLDAATTGLPVYALAPGETLPYDFLYWGPVNYKDGFFDLADSYSVQWDPYWTWESNTVYVTVPVNEISADFDEYYGTFIGEILNNTESTLNGGVVIISLYDNNGALVATNYEMIFDEIPVEGTAVYEIYLDIDPTWDPATLETRIIGKGELP